MIDYKINLSDKYLANILYKIGYHFLNLHLSSFNKAVLKENYKE